MGTGLYCQDFMRTLASTSHLPPLEHLELGFCNIRVSDIQKMIASCSTTLKYLAFGLLQLVASIHSTRDLWLFLRDHIVLQYLSVGLVHLSDSELIFPGLYAAEFEDEEDGEDYIIVDHILGVRFEGEKEVHHGLGQMLDCMELQG